MRDLLPAQRAELDRALAPIELTVRDSDAPDWWEGDDAEAMSMLAMIGGSRG